MNFGNDGKLRKHRNMHDTTNCKWVPRGVPPHSELIYLRRGSVRTSAIYKW